MKALFYLNKYLLQHKWALLAGVALTLLANVVAIFPPRLVKHAFDLVQQSMDTHQLTTAPSQRTMLVQGLLLYSAGIFLCAFLKSLFSLLNRSTFTFTGKRIEYALKNEIYRHYQTLPLSFYHRNSTGDLMARITEDVNRVGMYLGPCLMYIVSTTTTFLIVVPFMWSLDKRLTLYAGVPILFLAAGTYYVSTFLSHRSQAIQTQLSNLTTLAQESFAGIRVLQAFACEKAFTKKFSEACQEYQTRALRLTAINAFFFPAVVGIIGLGTVMVVWIGGQAVIKGAMTPGTIAEFVMYLHLLGWPTFSISWITNFVQRAAASQQRINEFLQEKNPIVSHKALKTPIQGTLAFRNVSFTYPNSGIQALEQVSFEVAAGQSLAIVGTTGAGKTTLANLICRLYDVDKGSIVIDDVPIEDYAVPWLRQHLGYVPQDVFLFADTIYNNIALGAPQATPAQLVAAAQQADIYSTIQQLPDQMQTVIGERGVTLSGGQKQRLSIARAFVRNPKILVLDDCLSAVDTQTEQSILQAMAKVMQGRTTIIISHRIAAAKLADHILVLEAGKVVEQGSHQHLWSRKGLYHALHERQVKEDKRFDKEGDSS
ncbi:MAG: ABC transporter ATP-binding protein [Bacteroidota bacterium]